MQRSYTAYDYEGVSDCPRIYQTRVSAEHWTGTEAVPAAEVVTQFPDPGDGSRQMIAPDGTIYKEFYGSSWQHGLVTGSEVWSKKDPDHGVERQKWSTIAYTQDNEAVNYQTNPRVVDTNIYDANHNRRRTTIDYDSYAQYGLPHVMHEYAADGPEIRRSYTDYNLSQVYLDRRIIGLVSASHLYDPVTGQWQAKATYGYDDPARLQSQATTAPGHDQSYDGSFTVRGNLTAVSRWDVNDIGNSAKALTSYMSYDAAGSVLSSIDPAGHTTSISYADSFSDNNNGRGTFAYATTATDADGNSSFAQYNYEFGAKTRVEGPPPQNQPNGIVQTFTFDEARRVKRATVLNTGAYAHYEYGPNYTQTFSSVNTVSADPYSSDSYSFQVFDGLGQVIEAGSNNPGSAGGYKAQVVQYDSMGRAVKQSNPTEIAGNSVPSGDDAAGWIYTQQTYDWKGRPLETRHLTDGSVKYASYGGCGCASGEGVTLIDETGRQQNSYSDALGRQRKIEVLNGDGSIYSTATKSFNARDQLMVVRQYQGQEGSGVYQDTTMSYDGYGRLQSKHLPEQNAGAATVYSYNTDDTVQSVTDARGASCTYEYNGRQQVKRALHILAGQNSIDISYGYDAAGNRTSMSDPQGSTSYSYDQLSRMTSESRTFTGVGTFTLSYDYNLAGELNKITDPTNVTINYNYDQTGRVTSITGEDNLFGGVSQYASGINYRAWGAAKGMTYGKLHARSELQWEATGVAIRSSRRYTTVWTGTCDQVTVSIL